MGKHVSRVFVSSKALKESPDGRQCQEEAHKPRVGGITLLRLVPMTGVQTKEQLNVLGRKSTVPCQHGEQEDHKDRKRR